MLGKKKRQEQEAQVERQWEQLASDDPFVREYAPMDDVVWNGVTALDWKKRKEPGTPRERCECLLVLTNNRIFVVNQWAKVHIPHSDLLDVEVKRRFVQGIVKLRLKGKRGDYVREYSMQAAVASVFADRLRGYLNA